MPISEVDFNQPAFFLVRKESFQRRCFFSPEASSIPYPDKRDISSFLEFFADTNFLFSRSSIGQLRGRPGTKERDRVHGERDRASCSSSSKTAAISSRLLSYHFRSITCSAPWVCFFWQRCMNSTRPLTKEMCETLVQYLDERHEGKS
jgi:hypothetical protein